MRISPRKILPAVAATALAVGITGCGWFAKDSPYQLAEEARPLEVPPDLDRPATAGAMEIPGQADTTSVMRSSLGQPTAAQAASGFTIPGDRGDVFTRVGTLLAATPGVEVASSAAVLGVYDVAYKGRNFLVRVSDGNGGVYVSAVDPRGVPATGAAALELIAALQAGL